MARDAGGRRARAVRTDGGRGQRTARSAGRVRSRPYPSSFRVHWGRLAVLAIVLLAGALYVGPLREFFAQQDRCQRELGTLQQLQQQNRAFKRQIAEINSKAWVLRTARENLGLVPPGTQSFVVEGLPDEEPEPVTRGTPSAQSLSLLQRLQDLWQTILH